jgi:anti-sigma factor RsiW
MKNDNPARKKFEPMLSPFVDGELTPAERQQVEQHLAANKESAMQVQDFRAASGLMRLTFEDQADQEDWKDFSAQVLSKLTPEKAPFFERLKLSLSEMFTYQRTMFVTSMATAALVALVAVPVAMKLAASPAGYGQAKVEVQMVKVDQGSTVEPVVMTTEKGDAIIWMVDQQKPEEPKKQDDKVKKDDEKSEEMGGDNEPKKAGEL